MQWLFQVIWLERTRDNWLISQNFQASSFFTTNCCRRWETSAGTWWGFSTRWSLLMTKYRRSKPKQENWETRRKSSVTSCRSTLHSEHFTSLSDQRWSPRILHMRWTITVLYVFSTNDTTRPFPITNWLPNATEKSYGCHQTCWSVNMSLPFERWIQHLLAAGSPSIRIERWRESLF